MQNFEQRLRALLSSKSALHFQSSEIFESVLNQIYDSVFVPLMDIINENKTLSAVAYTIDGPGYKELDGNESKTSIDVKVFRNDKQILFYSLTYVDEHSEGGKRYEPKFFRSIQTTFYSSQEEAIAALAKFAQTFDFDSDSTESEQAIEEAMAVQQDFSLDPETLKREVEEDLLHVLEQVL